MERLRSSEDFSMAGKVVNVVLNQQQIELLDGTVARGVAPDREAVLRTALKEFAAKNTAPASGKDQNR
jgi:hypothetical protein